MQIIIIILMILLLVVGAEVCLKTKKKQINIDSMIFQKNDCIFSRKELVFYRKLKNITNELNLVIFPKISLTNISTTSEKVVLNRIKSKHIDYLICDTDNCKIKLGIELDDYTEKKEKQNQSDDFKNKLFETIGIKLIRVKVSNFYNLEELERQIRETL